MAITYTWDFSAFECYPEFESHADVVFTIHWRVTADDGAGHIADTYSTQSVEYKAGSPFTPYKDLQPAQVQGWVEAAMGEDQVNAMKASLDAQIAAQINPTQVTLPAPWAITATATV